MSIPNLEGGSAADNSVLLNLLNSSFHRDNNGSVSLITIYKSAIMEYDATVSEMNREGFDQSKFSKAEDLSIALGKIEKALDKSKFIKKFKSEPKKRTKELSQIANNNAVGEKRYIVNARHLMDREIERLPDNFPSKLSNGLGFIYDYIAKNGSVGIPEDVIGGMRLAISSHSKNTGESKLHIAKLLESIVYSSRASIEDREKAAELINRITSEEITEAPDSINTPENAAKQILEGFKEINKNPTQARIHNIHAVLWFDQNNNIVGYSFQSKLPVILEAFEDKYQTLKGNPDLQERDLVINEPNSRHANFRVAIYKGPDDLDIQPFMTNLTEELKAQLAKNLK